MASLDVVSSMVSSSPIFFHPSPPLRLQHHFLQVGSFQDDPSNKKLVCNHIKTKIRPSQRLQLHSLIQSLVWSHRLHHLHQWAFDGRSFMSKVKARREWTEQRKKQTARTMYLIINFQVSSKGNLHEDHLLDSAWRRWHKQCEGEHGKVAWSAPQWKYVASHLPHQPAHSCTNQEDVHCQHDELHRQSPSKWIEPRALLWLQRLKALLDPHLGQTLEEWDWVAEGKPNVRY